MASREEEKRLRREERERAQAAAAASRGRAKRAQFLIGALLTIAIVVGVVLAVTGGGNSGDGNANTPTASKDSSAAIPAAAQRDLAAAAKAAGCVLLDPPLEGSTHVSGKVRYRSNPPTSGNHNPDPSPDGFYPSGPLPKERNVHALEHGRIDFMYRPGSPKHLIAQLETLVSEPLNGKDGYKALLFENNTGMPFQVAAASWQHYLGCPSWNENVIDAIRAYREQYVDKGPEFIP